MRLSLMGWPPLASHLVCLILGMAIANLSVEGPAERISLPAKSITLTIPKTKRLKTKTPIKPGMRVYAVQPGKSPCRALPEVVLIASVAPQLELSSSLAMAAHMPQLAQGLAAGVLTLVPSEGASGLPTCAQVMQTMQPKVTYGR